MKYWLAVGNSRRDKKWKNLQVDWDEIIKKVSDTYRTTETVAEYSKMTKDQQGNIKDIGGFVGGKLKYGLRKKESIEHRSLITLDLDYAKPGVWEDIEMFFDMKCCIYSTHKHTPKKPRLRLVIPIDRHVTSDEYAAISRKIAEEIDIEQFDDTSYQTTRLMYWPSTSSDGEYLFKNINGKLLKADEVLKKYDDWKDTSQWPVSSRQTTVINREVKKQEDPLSKKGLIGAFCRAYLIDDAIEEFLSEVYSPSIVTGRYDYIKGESSAGVVTYDDKFSFSHHATDPAGGKLCNAFDLVRIHKFGMGEESVKQMTEFCTQDKKVKKLILEEKQAQAAEDFNVESYNNWHEKLDIDKNGKVKNSLENLILILENDSNLKSITFNELIELIEVEHVPWREVDTSTNSKYWRDQDDSQLLVYLDRAYGNFSARVYDIAFSKVIDDRSFHPIKDYLGSLLEWDQVERLDSLFIDYFNSDDNAYTRAATRKWFCGAIARIYKPGIKFDTMLVLNGPQGIGKSTLVGKMGKNWFNDGLILSDTKDKTAAEKLQGYWIMEIGEMAGIKKADSEILKGFLARREDIYRKAFAKRVTPHPRQCVFVGTTNSTIGYLQDTTGNRRFFPIKTPDRLKRSWEITDQEIDQIWAEAVFRYKAGEELVLKGEAEEIAKKEQIEAMETDEREGIVREYLDKLLPENWDKMNLYERRNFLDGDFDEVQGTVKREKVCNLEIWCECFRREAPAIRKIDSYGITAMMVKLHEWEKYEGNKKGTQRFPIYGEQRCYVKNNPN